jgi:hypothetical protein
VPPSLSALIGRLLAKRPEQRFAGAAELRAALAAIEEEVAHGVRAEPTAAPLAAAVAVRAFAASSTVVALALAGALYAKRTGMVAWGQSSLVVQTAWVGAAGVGIALVLLGALALVRRGELPLPGSTRLLVSVKDLAGGISAAVVFGSSMLGPPAFLNLATAIVAAIALVSWVYGFFLRIALASRRADGGEHMLALLGDPRLRRWRRLHVPVLSVLSFVAAARFALLAYFQAS